MVISLVVSVTGVTEEWFAFFVIVGTEGEESPDVNLLATKLHRFDGSVALDHVEGKDDGGKEGANQPENDFGIGGYSIDTFSQDPPKFLKTPEEGGERCHYITLSSTAKSWYRKALLILLLQLYFVSAFHLTPENPDDRKVENQARGSHRPSSTAISDGSGISQQTVAQHGQEMSQEGRLSFEVKIGTGNVG